MSQDSNSVIRRIRKRSKYTSLDNSFLQNAAMTFEARGLLALMLSLPSDWTFRFNWLTKQSPNTKADRLRRLMKELASFGYLKMVRVKREGGRFAWEYLLTEAPFDFAPPADFPYMENPSMENPSTENRHTYKEHSKESKPVNKAKQKRGETTTTTEKANGGGGAPPSSASPVAEKKESPLVEALKDFLAKNCGGENSYFVTDTMVIRTARALGSRYDSVLAFKNDNQEIVDWICYTRPSLNKVREAFGLGAKGGY